jgi:hypothetical protein
VLGGSYFWSRTSGAWCWGLITQKNHFLGPAGIKFPFRTTTKDMNFLDYFLVNIHLLCIRAGSQIPYLTTNGCIGSVRFRVNYHIHLFGQTFFFQFLWLVWAQFDLIPCMYKYVCAEIVYHYATCNSFGSTV